ncbi:hypothetical protein EUTSA_v10005693mg [Eutrema salsugineum]|uniref:Uncharacterized protein n=1 Tax=Eutrema salsugineum TaxID=72664 RepID=V4KJL2_EUTSA|nr:periaxin [Eutrema salsugineum]ESQ31409.1 hypothetical protein EUTSA_v10005693mg [Eutrema salsugineum]
MGNCATKPKVLKDSDEDLIPVERETTAPTDHPKNPAEKRENNAPNAAEEAAAAARRSEKGKEILIEDDVEEHSKRQSLSHLFLEDKAVKNEVTDLTPTKPETNIKTGASSEVSKLDTSALMASNVKAPETFDVQTRNDLEVKIPEGTEVKTPDTPKAKEAEEKEVNFSENWDVKFPEELEAKKTSQVVKVAKESKLPQVSAPEFSEIKVTKESGVPDQVLEVKNATEISDIPAEIQVIKESNVPEVLEDKNTPEVSKVKTNQIKVAESELLKVSEVNSSEDLEIKVPKVFEVKTPETSNVKIESELKTDQEASNVKIAEETEVPKFVHAQEKIDKAEAQILDDIKVTEDKGIVMPKTGEGEKDLSFGKQVKESTTLSDLDNK